jgi:hypothetical protein
MSERILQETASGLSFDFGFQYDTGYHGAKLGMAMKNFGSNLEFSGSDFESNQQPPGSNPQSGVRTFTAGSSRFELPSHFELGMSYPIMQGVNKLSAFGLYQSNSFTVDEGRFGLEWGYRNDASLRLGYKLTTSDDDLFGLSYGLGVRVPLGGSNMFIDYAGQTVSDFFDDVQHVSLRFTF